MKIAKKRVDKGLWWDRAWSLVEGCTPVSPGCDRCWSAADTYRKSHQKSQAIRSRYESLTEGDPNKVSFNGKTRLMWKDLKKPTPKQYPATWAIWNDLFHEDVPFKFIVMAFERMYLCPQHTFIICTKRSRHMKYPLYLIWAILKTKYPKAIVPLPNVIGMVTAENQKTANFRIMDLIEAPFAIRAINVEPMLESIDIFGILDCHVGCPYRDPESPDAKECNECDRKRKKEAPYTKIDWILCGAEAGHGARYMDYNHARELIDICEVDTFDIPFWMKSGNVGEEIPDYLNLRELPRITR